MDLRLAGKVALVTGSSRGIGRGIATRLVEEGADVVFCARGAEALEAAVAEAPGPGRAHGVVADVSTAEGSASVVDAAVSAFGRLDVVVNNVGGSGAGTFDGLDADDLETVLGKNLVPAVLVSRAALPVLRGQGGGVIAMIASIFGRDSAILLPLRSCGRRMSLRPTSTQGRPTIVEPISLASAPAAMRGIIGSAEQ